MNPSGRVTEERARRSRGGIRILGVPVRLHFTFILLVIFIVTLGARGGGSAAFNAIYILALFASVLLHELGHVGVSKRYGIRTLEIVLYPIGGVARLERSPKPKEELWIALAGPRERPDRCRVVCLSRLYASGSALEFARHAVGREPACAYRHRQSYPCGVQHGACVSHGWRPGASIAPGQKTVRRTSHENRCLRWPILCDPHRLVRTAVYAVHAGIHCFLCLFGRIARDCRGGRKIVDRRCSGAGTQ